MSGYIKKTLKELMDDELAQMELPSDYRTLELFINDGKKSAKFIRYLLKDDSYNIPNDDSPLYEVAESRSRHSAVTFLMGLAFSRFGDLFVQIPSIIHYDVGYARDMWLKTSLYHDKAYSSEYLRDATLDIQKKFLPFLLTDEHQSNLPSIDKFSHRYPGTLAYTYEEILNYDKYAIKYHQSKNNEDEKRDHGIVGGVMMFSDLAKKALKKGKPTELTMIKACSLAVAQHNIFKSPNEKYDKKYEAFELNKLLSTSSFQITPNQPLLLFLSLIDTVECVKKFSRGQNSDKYLKTLTVLKSINVSVQADSIEIDYSALKKEVFAKKDKELIETFNSYLKSVGSLNTWTTFLAEFDSSNPSKCKITLGSGASLPEKSYDCAAIV